MKEVLEKRIAELTVALEASMDNHKKIQQSFEQNAANHNMILGAKSEAEGMLTKLFAQEVSEEVAPKKLSGAME
jgi:hypothetical protein